MSSVHSDVWHRVAELRPRLAPQVRVRRQRARGATWWLLADAVSGRSARLNRAAYEIAGRFTGQHSVQALWQARQQHDAEPPTQDELVQLLATLREQGLVEVDRGADFAPLQQHLARTSLAAPRPNLLAWRVPLGNPSVLLARVAPWLRGLRGPWLRGAWWLAVAWLAAATAWHFGALWDYGARWAATPRFALWSLLCYVPLKALHELAHGLVLRHHGAEVREAGVTLMLGIPVPYVDASGATTLPGVRQRLQVSGAGIAVELAAAALALALWLVLPDGAAREAAFVVLGVAGASTLLVNGNPLQRLDGYHLFTDALQLPNLAPRSRAWWLDLARRRGLALADTEPMPLARGERPWLVAYAPLSWAWSLGLATLSVLWLAALSAPLGLAAGLVLAVQLVLLPAWRLWQPLAQAAQAQGGARQRLRRAAWGLGALALAALALPLPRHLLAQGVLWPPEQAQLRADSAGLVAELHAGDGQAVAPGDAVLTLANPALAAQHSRQAARLAAVEAELIQASSSASDGGGERSGNLRAEQTALQAELARLDERTAGLVLRAQVAGQLALPGAADLPQQWVPQGRLLGQVLTGAPPVVRVALPEDQAHALAQAGASASVLLAEHGGSALPARLLRDSRAAAPQLPSAALSQHHGGAVLTDPQDDQHLRSLQPVVLVDVQLERQPPGAPRLGGRAWVRLELGWAPLAWQAGQSLWRRWRQAANPQH